MQKPAPEDLKTPTFCGSLETWKAHKRKVEMAK